jgi:hypothetical protein
MSRFNAPPMVLTHMGENTPIRENIIIVIFVNVYYAGYQTKQVFPEWAFGNRNELLKPATPNWKP